MTEQNNAAQTRHPPWHVLTGDETLAQQRASPDGLSQSEAESRLTHFGPNHLATAAGRSPAARFALQFHNILIYVLLGSAAVTAALAHWADTGVILGVVVINAVVGFVQEGKAEQALNALQQLLPQYATARRNGRWQSLLSTELVPGDMVRLQPGDKVPADIRLLSTRELRIDESMLTGESTVVEKGIGPVDESAVVADRACMAYSGTMVTDGLAEGVVVATAQETEIGRISSMMRGVPVLQTPLLRKMARFSRWLSLIILISAVATFVFGMVFRGYSAADMFVAVVGLAVAAIPEGLPAIVTITLAIGVRRMARRNAVIRRLPAVETLGAVTVICSDKTGTLTRNEMTVRSVALYDGLISVLGEGYAPEGDFVLDGAVAGPNQLDGVVGLARAGLLCNDADLRFVNGQWQLSGDPTEGALITLALKAELDSDEVRAAYSRVDVIPFQSQQRFMATLNRTGGEDYVFVKGAPERVLDMCSHERHAERDFPLQRAYWDAQMRRMAESGQRLLAFATKQRASATRGLETAELASGFSLLGVVGMIDPPRADAVQAIRNCREAGINVKMITGDHVVTAVAVGFAMGMHGKAIDSAELDGLSDLDIQRVAAGTEIFARATPEHKLRLVTALQADGEVVAMTGDGVNDAPALKRADVGIAMGRKGTEVAKEAAEVVLIDDNFASIADAVVEGRTVFDNLKKSILFILPTSGGEALTILAAIAIGRELPITPVQILWVNMVTAVTLALALAFEPAEDDLMRRPPRPPTEPLLSSFLVWRTVFVSLLLVSGTFGLYLWYREHGADLGLARTVAVNTLVFFEIFYLFNCRRFSGSGISRRALVGNPYLLYAVCLLLGIQLLFTYAPPLQRVFATSGIDVADWMRIVGVSFAVFVIVELEKSLMRRVTGRARPAIGSSK